jgi:hypothetical protein
MALKASQVAFRIAAACALVLAAILTPLVAWRLASDRPLDVLLVDKTVPVVDDFREHGGLVWALNHFKYVGRDTSYRLASDYAGFVPLPDLYYRIRPIPLDGPPRDLIYVADTYGVYIDDFGRINFEGTHSPKIYGGIEPSEISALDRQVRPGGVLVGEFNSFASPTVGGARDAMEKLLGARWSGWAGRWFADLTPKVEVPVWAVSDYAKQFGRPWSFKGPGYLFVHESGRLFVLTESDDVRVEGLTLHFMPERGSRYGARDGVPFRYWFDVVTPMAGSTIEAEYRFDLTARGDSTLAYFGVPARFPAILRRADPARTTYYFAGDFVDNGRLPSWHRVRWADLWFRYLPEGFQSENSVFYWKVYLPLLKTVLREATSPG